MCDLPRVFDSKDVKARKQHKCCECWESIAPGDTYVLNKGNWDGEWDTYKQCRRCNELATWLHHEGIECIAFTMLWQSLMDTYGYRGSYNDKLPPIELLSDKMYKSLRESFLEDYLNDVSGDEQRLTYEFNYSMIDWSK